MPRILIVDDEKNILEALRFLLEKKYDLTFCDSGCKALEAVKKVNYDIVIADICLGDISGNEVLKKVKERHKETDVIMISAYRKVDNIFDAGKYGACDFILKPFDKDEMLNLIENLLERRKTKIESSICEDMADKFSDNECKIMRLLSEKKTNKEIAMDLKRNEVYVKNTLRVIYLKLEAKDRAEAKKKILSILSSNIADKSNTISGLKS